MKSTDFLLVSLFLILELEASFGQLPDLHLVIFIIEDLPFRIQQSYPQRLYLHRQPLNLYSLKHHNKIQPALECFLLIIR